MAEIAVALIPLVAAGLLARSLAQLIQRDGGIVASHAETFELTLPASSYPDEASITRLYTGVLARIRQVPGVESAGLTASVPLTGAANSTGIRIPGRDRRASATPFLANYTVVSPGYLAAAGTPLLAGHDFRDSDIETATPVCVINQAMATAFWPRQNPIGQQVGPGALTMPVETIIGVAANVDHVHLGEAAFPEMYVNYRQHPWPSMQTMDLVVRGRKAITPAALAAAVHAVDPGLPLAKMAPLAEARDAALAAPRFAARLIVGLALLALLLAAGGIYGVMAFAVRGRTREIGVRMALGASASTVRRMVLREGAALAALGIAAGLAVAAVGVHALRAFLFQVQPLDAITFAAAPALVLLAAVLACYAPARRATRIRPTEALRAE